MANDKDKNSQKLRSFNEPTIQFIRDLIGTHVFLKVQIY